jgi:hypothetical protein
VFFEKTPVIRRFSAVGRGDRPAGLRRAARALLAAGVD